jgi:hypothetical protein
MVLPLFQHGKALGQMLLHLSMFRHLPQVERILQQLECFTASLNAWDLEAVAVALLLAQPHKFL